MHSGPLAKIAADIRDGKIRPSDLIRDASERYEATEERLNAYRTWAGDRAKTQAAALDTLVASGVDLGPLMGIPVSVKDLFGVPGLPTYAGTNTAFPREWQAAGPVVGAVLAQMGIVTGKTHTVEFAFGGLGTNPGHFLPFGRALSIKHRTRRPLWQDQLNKRLAYPPSARNE